MKNYEWIFKECEWTLFKEYTQRKKLKKNNKKILKENSPKKTKKKLFRKLTKKIQFKENAPVDPQSGCARLLYQPSYLCFSM